MKRNDDLAGLYRSMMVGSAWSGPLSRTVSEINSNRKRYQVVSAKTGVPWQVIAAIHWLEGSGDFNTHLHNGDSLKARTRNVPAGRPRFGNPPFTWEESAADALEYDGLTRHKWNTDIGEDLLKIELFNGPGYRNRKLNSPYLWSGTQWYDKGKYVADRKFDPTAVSKQLGAAPILKALAF